MSRNSPQLNEHYYACECGVLFHDIYEWAHHANHCKEALALEGQGMYDRISELHRFEALAQPRSPQRIEALEMAIRVYEDCYIDNHSRLHTPDYSSQAFIKTMTDLCARGGE